MPPPALSEKNRFPMYWRRRLRSHWNGLGFGWRQGSAALRALAGESLRPGPAPQRRGEIRLHGLHAPVEILRDRSGVPHCFAQNPDDALFALGFVHLQDRFWQMEFFRRLTGGRMAEVAGPKALPADRFMRHIGLHRAAQAAWDATPPGLQARLLPYLLGINAAFAHTPRPLELRLLDYQPDPWRPEDCVQAGKGLAFFLSPGWDAQILRARLVEAAGLEAVLALDPGYPQDGPVIAPPGAPYGRLGADLEETYAEIVRQTGLGTLGQGSNNWAVAADRSATGHAFLAADPHLAAVLPAFAYFVHLECPEWSVVGATVPGLPGVIWGFNRRIAWAPTAGLAVTQELFVEEFQPGGLRYRTPGGWAEATIVEEPIAVRGHAPEVHRIALTRHGPVISPQLPDVRRALALQSTVLDPCHSGEGLLALFSARDFDEFRAALAGFHEFNLAFAYADVDGHAGLQLSGAVPRRRAATGWLPAPGWDPRADWDGYLPRADLPSTFDPPGGCVWSANNAPRPAQALGYPGEFLDQFRARRIGDLLHGADRPSPTRAQAWQLDRHSLPMQTLAWYLRALPPQDDRERALLAQIAQWDGVMAPASVAAAVVSATFSRLLHHVLRAKLGPATPMVLGSVHALAGANPVLTRGGSLLLSLLAATPADWFGPLGDGREAKDVDGRAVWSAVLLRAFREAQALLGERLGNDPARWTWGRCHRLTLRHGLGVAPPLAALLNAGPFAFGGDANTLFQAGPVSTDPFAPVSTIPALRLVVEMTPHPTALFALPGGQSGRRGDPHALDLFDDWRRGRFRPLHTQRDTLAAEGAQRLRLTPASGR